MLVKIDQKRELQKFNENLTPLSVTATASNVSLWIIGVFEKTKDIHKIHPLKEKKGSRVGYEPSVAILKTKRFIVIIYRFIKSTLEVKDRQSGRLRAFVTLIQ